MERLMRTEKMYDPKATFYALKEFKYAGRVYSRGDEFASKDMTNRKLLQFFQNGYVGYATDFKTNKTNMKEVEIKKEEVVAEEHKQEEDQSTKTTTRKRRTKKDSE